ncbi:MAG: glycosyltransferase [Lachnospiraceae bacterium]|nr:glycosyltransferase [Lachnospiraceae bacterium]
MAKKTLDMITKEKNFLSAVVYVHNDEKEIGHFLDMLIECFETNFEHSEIICVNDHSDDESVRVIKEAGSRTINTTITILNMSYFHGVELAMDAGMDLTIGDFVLEFDSVICDFSKDEIMRVYKKALEGNDIVSASPNKKPRASSKLFYFVFNRFANYSYNIVTERFRILSRRVINRINDMNKSVPYRKAAYANCGLKSCNIKYDIELNALSDKKDDKKEDRYRRELAVNSLILFTEIGYKFSVTMTIIMMLVAVAVAIYSAVVYIFSTPVAGWTTTIFFMAFAFFGLFGILTVIIKYLQILVDLIFKRKKYNFESIEKL